MGARRKGRTLEPQNAGAMGAPGSKLRKDSLDEPKRTHQEPAEAMVKEESAGVTWVTRGKVKWQGDGTGDSPVYIKFSYSA